MVRLLNLRDVPEFTIDQPVVAIVIVPPEGSKVAVELFVSVPLIVNELEVVTVAPEAIVMLAKVRVPELLIEAPLLNVVVPLDGVKTPLAPTVKVPPIVPVPAPVWIEFALIKTFP